MYFLLKMGIFKSAMLVYQSVHVFKICIVSATFPSHRKMEPPIRDPWEFGLTSFCSPVGFAVPNSVHPKKTQRSSIIYIIYMIFISSKLAKSTNLSQQH